MAQIFGSLEERQIGSCFGLAIPLWYSSEEIEDCFYRDTQIKLATKAMLDGKASFEDLLDMVEDCVPNMDLYLEEVENNLIYDGFVTLD